MTTPSFRQFDDTIRTSPEDADCGQRQRDEKTLESPGPTEGHKNWILVEGCLSHGFVSLVGTKTKIDAEEHEYKKREDLESQAGDHDVIANIGRLVVVRRSRGKSSPSSLEKERNEIAWNEL